MLKQEYKEDETKLSDALGLAVKVLSKTLDMTKVTPEKCKLKFRCIVCVCLYHCVLFPHLPKPTASNVHHACEDFQSVCLSDGSKLITI